MLPVETQFLMRPRGSSGSRDSVKPYYRERVRARIFPAAIGNTNAAAVSVGYGKRAGRYRPNPGIQDADAGRRPPQRHCGYRESLREAKLVTPRQIKESGKDARVADVTVYHDSQHPSALDVPVVK